jgi:hypothetical protein
LNSPGLFVANVEDKETMASVLVNPPPTFGQLRAAGRGAGAPPAGGAGGRGRGGHTGPAFYIKASASADGTFTVTNTRNNFSKTYAAGK